MATSVPVLVEALTQASWFDSDQKAVLPQLEAQFSRPQEFARELVRRGWLTPFQAEHLLRGRIRDLCLGQYLLLDQVGEGGMGQVYRAWQRKLQRIVALKVIRPECLDNPRVLLRFQREIRAAGHVSHPNIVHAFDADQIGGTHFIAMEYIDGVDVARLVKDHGPLPVGQACEIIRQAALGLQHAYERGLVHRDIKPANLLVAVQAEREAAAPAHPTPSERGDSGLVKRALRTAGSGSGGVGQASGARKISSGVLRRLPVSAAAAREQRQPRLPTPETPPTALCVKILDLGLARWDDTATGRASTHITQMGSVMGTPDFIAPEQARNSHTTDIRADLYSLGCTLYFMLAGRIPFPGGSFPEKLLKHQMDEPEPILPIRRALLSFHLGQQGKTKIPRRMLAVPDEVEKIVKKLMAKRPEERYQTPAELVAALELAQSRAAQEADVGPAEALAPEADVPIPEALPIPTVVSAEPLVKVATIHQLAHRRSAWGRRAATLGTAAATFSLALGLAVFSGGQARPRADDAAAKSDAPLEAAWKALQHDLALCQHLPDTCRDRLLEFKRQHPAKAQAVAEMIGRLPSPFDGFQREKLHGKQVHATWPEEVVGVLGTPRPAWLGRGPQAVAVTADGRWIATAGEDRAVRLWDATAPSVPYRIDVSTWGRVNKVAISSDGRRLAAAGDDGLVRLYDRERRELVQTLPRHKSPVTALAFHPSEPILATGGLDGVVRLWEVDEHRWRTELPGAGRVVSLTWSSDGAFVFWGGDDHEVRWASAAGRVSPEWGFPVGAPVTSLALHPDGRHVVCAGGDGSVRICTFDGSRLRDSTRFQAHRRAVYHAAIAPDGHTLVTTGDDLKLVVWSIRGGAPRQAWDLPHAPTALAYAPDSRHLLVAGGGVVLIFRIETPTTIARGR